jgi:hypothetical protein
LIEASAKPGHSLQKKATAVGPDRWLTEIDEDVADIVKTRRLTGESDDAVIEGLVIIALSGVQ